MGKKGSHIVKTYEELSDNQQRFVDYYDGNATQAAEKAGYSHPTVAGSRLLRNVNIKTAIREREIREREPGIYTRTQRQIFWTDIITGTLKETVTYDGKDNNVEPSLQTKLRASELLGRSQADFMDKVAHGGPPDENGELTEIPLLFLGPGEKAKDKA